MSNKVRQARSSCFVRQVGSGTEGAHRSGNLRTVDTLTPDEWVEVASVLCAPALAEALGLQVAVVNARVRARSITPARGALAKKGLAAAASIMSQAPTGAA